MNQSINIVYDPLCKAWPLRSSVIEDDNVEIPADEKLYFYIKIVASFATLYVSDMENMESFDKGEIVETGDNKNSFMIPRENLLCDGDEVLWATVSRMIVDVGVRPTKCMMDPIRDVARELVIETHNLDKKILPFFVSIYVEDYVDTHDDEEDNDDDYDDDDDDDEGSIDVMEEEEVRLSETTTTASEEQMRRPKTTTEICSAVELVGGEKCVICQDELSYMNESELKRMGCCRHVFHGDCIEKWLNLNNLCPLCRFQIST
ncbi:uncharacterized protein LOC124935146 [Impatiens glandulifera]|uniref:uncharacterized protein LOC124935146 n=1 Tax=Impatiens glandulifera TaxID=253017 RepID=UPI001FB05847|nr:uncharacterized protein LOC124935146 [Impatiens glandulifera]